MDLLQEAKKVPVPRYHSDGSLKCLLNSFELHLISPSDCHQTKTVQVLPRENMVMQQSQSLTFNNTGDSTDHSKPPK